MWILTDFYEFLCDFYGFRFDSYLIPHGFQLLELLESIGFHRLQPAQHWICSMPLDSYTIIVGSCRLLADPFGFKLGSHGHDIDFYRKSSSAIPHNSRIINTWCSGQRRGPPFGCRWIPIDPHWTLWSPMEPYGRQWKPVAYHVTLWNPRAIVVILWNDMESYEILWNHLYEPP